MKVRTMPLYGISLSRPSSPRGRCSILGKMLMCSVSVVASVPWCHDSEGRLLMDTARVPSSTG
jgi:hypothetical protein